MLYRKNKWFSLGFTIVELVVVATILAILWAVWFSAYTWYLDWARDSNRIVELWSIRSWLQKYNINNGELPMPTDYVTVQDGVDIVWYQWYASQTILDSIDLQKWWTDPKDGTYYTYYLSETRNHFQLLWFLEEEDSENIANITNVTNAIDYSARYPTITWESLGIMIGTWNDKNIPIQELDEILTTSNGILDIWGTSVEYTALISDDYTVTWDNSKLWVVAALARSGGQIWRNCKELLEGNSGLLWKNGAYVINPNWEELLEVYCDMITDWWGGTFFWHMNSSSTWVNFFENWVWTYKANRVDDWSKYSLGSDIFDDTEMMVTLDQADPLLADAANKIVFYKFPESHLWFNTWPIPCQALWTWFAYKTQIWWTYNQSWQTNSCTTTSWYTRTVWNALYLTLFHSSWLWNYWWAWMWSTNSWSHDWWWYLR
jgi:type II secretory pathway pseudopilin PulG